MADEMQEEQELQPEMQQEEAPAPEPAAAGNGTSLPVMLLRAVIVASLVIATTVGIKILAESTSAAPLDSTKTITSVYKFTPGTPAPDFQLTSLEGEMVSLADYRGQTVMINFWATWCPPCRSEMPDMEQIYQEGKTQDIVVLAVNMQEAKQPVQEFIDKYGLTFPVLLDTSGEISQKFGVQSLPTSLFIDPEGNVISFSVGALNKSAISKRLALVNQ